jgi:uncharacterized protein (TIGR02246 family)
VTVLASADALAILQLTARADTLATQRDAEGYAALFTEDGVMDGDEGQVTGREQLAASVARIWHAEPPGTLHLTCNAVIDEAATTPAVASLLLMLTPQPSLSVARAAHVFQRFLRTSEGWRITSRHITNIPPATADTNSQKERS